MSIGYQYIPLIIAGLAGMIWGLPVAHRLKFLAQLGGLRAVLLRLGSDLSHRRLQLANLLAQFADRVVQRSR